MSNLLIYCTMRLTQLLGISLVLWKGIVKSLKEQAFFYSMQLIMKLIDFYYLVLEEYMAPIRS